MAAICIYCIFRDSWIPSHLLVNRNIANIEKAKRLDNDNIDDYYPNE